MNALSRTWGLRLAVLGAAAGMGLAGSQRAEASGGAPAPLPFTFAVTSPGTGNQFVAGSTVVVNWTSTSPSSNVNISLVDVPNWVVVATNNNTADDGSEPFTIPANLPAGEYLFYIENVGVTEWAYGDSFYILECGSSALRQQSLPRTRVDRGRPLRGTKPAPEQR
jgi:hypothetical protein